MKKSLKGFTLVEMLIVISIIAILSSAILVGMGSSRSKARNAKVVSDMNVLQVIIENAYTTRTALTSGYPTSPDAITDAIDKVKANAIVTNGGNIHYCESVDGYRILGTLEAGLDADDIIKNTLAISLGTCTCPAYSTVAKSNTVYCVGGN